MEEQKLAIDFLSSLRNLVATFRTSINNEFQLCSLDLWIGIILVEYADLEKGSPITASELAKRAHIVPSSLTRVLNKMEKMGLISRRTPNDNRRIIYVELTSKGEEQLRNASQGAIEFTSRIFDKIGKKTAIDLLNIINDLNVIIQDLKIERRCDLNASITKY